MSGGLASAAAERGRRLFLPRTVEGEPLRSLEIDAGPRGLLERAPVSRRLVVPAGRRAGCTSCPKLGAVVSHRAGINAGDLSDKNGHAEQKVVGRK